MRLKIALYVCTIVLISILINGYDSETIKIMPFVVSNAKCLQCHDNDKSDIIGNPTMACDKFCLKCHKRCKLGEFSSRGRGGNRKFTACGAGNRGRRDR